MSASVSVHPLRYPLSARGGRTLTTDGKRMNGWARPHPFIRYNIRCPRVGDDCQRMESGWARSYPFIRYGIRCPRVGDDCQRMENG
jgi:hypothetical protein